MQRSSSKVAALEHYLMTMRTSIKERFFHGLSSSEDFNTIKFVFTHRHRLPVRGAGKCFQRCLSLLNDALNRHRQISWHNSESPSHSPDIWRTHAVMRNFNWWISCLRSERFSSSSSPDEYEYFFCRRGEHQQDTTTGCTTPPPGAGG